MSDIEKSSLSEIEERNGGVAITARVSGTVGTVGLIQDGEVALLPVPSDDPKDPLRLPFWRKCMLMAVVSLYAPLGLIAVSGMGSLIGFFITEPEYAGSSYASITRLITIPTLFMGISNFVFMPIGIAYGRRPVYLGSAVVLVIACACLASPMNKTYNWHIGFRCMLGLAAGQSEALVPLILKEAFFLHERARVLSWQSVLQIIVGGVLNTFAGDLAAAIGWRNWYAFYAGLAGLHLILAIFFVYETKFDRTKEAYDGIAGPAVLSVEKTEGVVYTINHPRPVNPALPPRTWRDSVGFPAHIEPAEALKVVKHMFELIWLPPVLVIVLMNSFYLGINIGIGTTYATILQNDFGFAPKAASYITAGQIIVGLLVLPMLGNLSDYLIKRRARANGGVHEPETRLLVVPIPVLISILACLLYGFGAQYPHKFHWFVLVFAYNAQYFGFVAASVAGQTYLLDSFPQRSGSVLVLVCALRGVISFGLTYGLVPMTDALGYALAYGVWTIVSTFLAALCVVIYFFGKPLRNWCQKYATDEVESEKPSMG